MPRTRINLHILCSGAAAAGGLLVLTGGLPTAAAASPPDPSRAFSNGCPLERIGTQLVRCDNLTGAGVRARSWLPEATIWAPGVVPWSIRSHTPTTTRIGG